MVLYHKHYALTVTQH